MQSLDFEGHCANNRAGNIDHFESNLLEGWLECAAKLTLPRCKQHVVSSNIVNLAIPLALPMKACMVRYIWSMHHGIRDGNQLI